jgi:cation diffusion facilitator family transporter
MQSNLVTSSKALRTTKVGILISLALVFVKAISGHVGHSYALIADATETGADVVSSVLLFFALRLAMKPADEEHPYGHGKAEPLAAIIISLFLLAAAAWIGWHAWEFIHIRHALPKPFTLGILAFVMAVKETLFRYVLKVGRELKSQAVQADAYHHRADAITSLAAFAGITVALIGGKGYESADDWAALLAAGLIVYNAIGLIRPALAEIMDTAPDREIRDKVRDAALLVPDVRDIEKCYARKMGFDYYIDLHLLVDSFKTVAEGHEIAHRVKDAIMEADKNIRDVLIHVEPFMAPDEGQHGV